MGWLPPFVSCVTKSDSVRRGLRGNGRKHTYHVGLKFLTRFETSFFSYAQHQDEDDDVIVEDYTEEDEGESTEADRDINRLRERKEDLERRLKQQQRKKAQIEVTTSS